MPEFETCCQGSIGAWWRRITFCDQKVDVTPKLPWEIDHSPVVNDISASPSWFSETKPCLINEISSASSCKNLCETGKDKIAHVSMDLPHSKRIRRAACINIQVIKWPLHTFTDSCCSGLILSEFCSKGCKMSRYQQCWHSSQLTGVVIWKSALWNFQGSDIRTYIHLCLMYTSLLSVLQIAVCVCFPEIGADSSPVDAK